MRRALATAGVLGALVLAPAATAPALAADTAAPGVTAPRAQVDDEPLSSDGKDDTGKYGLVGLTGMLGLFGYRHIKNRRTNGNGPTGTGSTRV